MGSIKDGKSDAQQIARSGPLHNGIFTMPAEIIAESLASREISPLGASSGLRLLTFYINRAGKWLSASRRKNLEKARKLLAERVARELAEQQRKAA